MVFLEILGGLAALILGGEFLVRCASKIATSFGMSQLLIGLTVVAFGTSAPELAICLDAVWLGKSDIAIGNIVGSNISNVLLILGLTAAMYPIVVQAQIVHREVPIMIGVSILFFLLCIDGILYPLEGLLLLAGMALFVWWQVKLELKTNPSKPANPVEPKFQNQNRPQLMTSFLGVAIGVALLWFGAGWMVHGAAKLAMDFGISKLVIGLTIVAIGSSAPEIVTALLAAKRGFPELAVGSVIGSNIANLLLVGGATIFFSPSIQIPAEAFQFDIPIMMVCSIACLPIFASGHTIDRWEGVFFLISYAIFTVVLFIKPVLSESFPSWSQLLWSFIIPLILMTCLALVLQRYRNGKRDAIQASQDNRN